MLSFAPENNLDIRSNHAFSYWNMWTCSAEKGVSFSHDRHSNLMRLPAGALLIFISVMFSVQAFHSVHQTGSCACVCSVRYAKIFEDCVDRFDKCNIVSCNPFVLGFACCTLGIKPFVDPATRKKAVNDLADISSKARTAAVSAREKSRKAANILFECEKNVTRIGRQRLREIGKQQLLIRMANNRVISLRKWMRRAFGIYYNRRRFFLQYVLTSLVKHLQR